MSEVTLESTSISPVELLWPLGEGIGVRSARPSQLRFGLVFVARVMFREGTRLKWHLPSPRPEPECLVQHRSSLGSLYIHTAKGSTHRYVV